MKKYTVYLGACSDYNPDTVADIIEKALPHISLAKPISGKIVIKPNLVLVHPKIAPDCHTRKEVIEGILKVIQKQGKDVEKIDIVEKSGLGVTTTAQFRRAGYKKLARKYKKDNTPVKLCAMEARRRTTVVLEKGKIHSHISIAKEMADRDFLIFAPKLKTNVLSHAYTGTLKLNIGTIDGKERMSRHHHQLPAKIVDILEIANPDLVVTDGIRLAFGGNQMTQHAADMGVVAVSSNAVAHDMVCAKLLDLDPFKIEHIREAMDRGYGPSSFDEIEIMGDFPVEKAQKISSQLDFGFFPVQQFPGNFKIHSGTPYCVGGCQGIFLDWLHMVKDRKPKRLKRFPRISVLIGKVNETIEDKKVILVGECARASPHVKTKKVVCINGCPPCHRQIVFSMMTRFRLLAPLVVPSLVIDAYVIYPLKKIKGWILNKRINC